MNSFVTSQPSIPAQIKEESTRTVIDIHPTPELRAALASLEGVAIIRVDVQYRRDTEGQSIIRCSYRQAAGSEACTRDYLRPALSELEQVLNQALAVAMDQECAGDERELRVDFTLRLDLASHEWRASGTGFVFELVPEYFAMDVAIR